MPTIPPSPRLPQNIDPHFHAPSTLPNQPSSGNSGSGSSSGGSDWQHLMVRFGEFIIGVVLIWVGIQAVVIKRPAAQTIIQTTGTVAKAVK